MISSHGAEASYRGVGIAPASHSKKMEMAARCSKSINLGQKNNIYFRTF